MPKTADILARVPPHIRAELQRLIAELPRHFREPSYGDMVGALILEARKAADRLPAQLSEYYDIKDAWADEGIERLPDL